MALRTICAKRRDRGSSLPVDSALPCRSKARRTFSTPGPVQLPPVRRPRSGTAGYLIDPSDGRVLRSVKLDGQAGAMSVDSSGRLLYVATSVLGAARRSGPTHELPSPGGSVRTPAERPGDQRHQGRRRRSHPVGHRQHGRGGRMRSSNLQRLVNSIRHQDLSSTPTKTCPVHHLLAIFLTITHHLPHASGRGSLSTASVPRAHVAPSAAPGIGQAAAWGLRRDVRPAPHPRRGCAVIREGTDELPQPNELQMTRVDELVLADLPPFFPATRAQVSLRKDGFGWGVWWTGLALVSRLILTQSGQPEVMGCFFEKGHPYENCPGNARRGRRSRSCAGEGLQFHADRVQRSSNQRTSALPRAADPDSSPSAPEPDLPQNPDLPQWNEQLS